MAIDDLPQRYLFARIQEAKEALLVHDPSAPLISLGIGDTTYPLPSAVATALAAYATKLGTQQGYSGYGPAEGWPVLRAALADRIYGGQVSPDELFISDGAKCDLGRLALVLPRPCRSLIQDPSYPVYLDLSCLLDHQIIPLTCTPENNFFPPTLPEGDLLYLCSPNNPTGAVLSHTQLQQAVDWAHKHRAILVFDAAYAPYIQDPALPRSIYEIPNARDVAIEIGSFSKLAGFTGVRLGWTVIPKEHPLHPHWPRLLNTVFNGPSNLAQAGGMAVLAQEGWQAIHTQIQTYRDNAAKLTATLHDCQMSVYGGVHAPYLWTHTSKHTSWELFTLLLERAHLVTVPGAGFGSQGEGFLRLSAFGDPCTVEEACRRLKQALS